MVSSNTKSVRRVANYEERSKVRKYVMKNEDGRNCSFQKKNGH